MADDDLPVACFRIVFDGFDGFKYSKQLIFHEKVKMILCIVSAFWDEISGTMGRGVIPLLLPESRVRRLLSESIVFSGRKHLLCLAKASRTFQGF